MKTTVLATTLLLALATVGTAQSAEAAPINIAPAGIVTLADFETDRSDLLHTVKGFKKGHRGGRGFGRRGFGNRGFGHRGFRRGGFGHRGFGHGGFRNHGFGHSNFNQGHGGHHGKSFGLFGNFFGFKK